MKSLADNLTDAIKVARIRGLMIARTATDPGILIDVSANEYATGVNHMIEFILKNPRVPIANIHRAFLTACERQRISIVPVNVEPLEPHFDDPIPAPEEQFNPQETTFPENQR